MWPLDRQRSVLRIGRERLELWTLQAGRGHRIAEQPIDTDSAANADAMRSALVALMASSEISSEQHRPLDAIVESAWLPVMPLMLNKATWPRKQLEALLKHQLSQVYEPSASPADWGCLVDHHPGARFALGYALPPAVRSAIVDTVRQRGIKLASLQPALAWSWRLFRAASKGRTGAWWLWHEQDRVIAAWVKSGRIVALNAAADRPLAAKEYTDLLLSESVRQGIEEQEPGALIAAWSPDPAAIEWTQGTEAGHRSVAWIARPEREGSR